MKKTLSEILKKPPMKKLKEPKEYWHDDGKACDVVTHEIDYDKQVAQIRELVPKKINSSYSENNPAIVARNQAIDDILETLI